MNLFLRGDRTGPSIFRCLHLEVGHMPGLIPGEQGAAEGQKPSQPRAGPRPRRFARRIEVLERNPLPNCYVRLLASRVESRRMRWSRLGNAKRIERRGGEAQQLVITSTCVDRARTPPSAATGQPDDRSGERQRRGERRALASGWGLAVAGSPPLPPRCHLLILNYAIFISCDHICSKSRPGD